MTVVDPKTGLEFFCQSPSGQILVMGHDLSRNDELGRTVDALAAAYIADGSEVKWVRWNNRQIITTF